MPKPMGKRKTKKTYLGSGAGSLKSGTGATAKAKKPKSRVKQRNQKLLDDLTKKVSRATKRQFATGPATGLDKVFDRSFTEAKKQRKRMATTMRKKAKR